MRYTVTVPPTREQGSYKTVVSSGRYETRAKAALSDYNSARAHDALPPIARMPRGTRYARTYLARPGENGGRNRA